jgi:hypothetical protein
VTIARKLQTQEPPLYPGPTGRSRSEFNDRTPQENSIGGPDTSDTEQQATSGHNLSTKSILPEA